jgi:hypothetical protein
VPAIPPTSANGAAFAWLSRLLNTPLLLLAEREAKPTDLPSSRRERPVGLIPALATLSPKGGCRSPWHRVSYGQVHRRRHAPGWRRKEVRIYCSLKKQPSELLLPGAFALSDRRERPACGCLDLERPRRRAWARRRRPSSQVRLFGRYCFTTRTQPGSLSEDRALRGLLTHFSFVFRGPVYQPPTCLAGLWLCNLRPGLLRSLEAASCALPPAILNEHFGRATPPWPMPEPGE